MTQKISDMIFPPELVGRFFPHAQVGCLIATAGEYIEFGGRKIDVMRQHIDPHHRGREARVWIRGSLELFWEFSHHSICFDAPCDIHSHVHVWVCNDCNLLDSSDYNGHNYVADGRGDSTGAHPVNR